MELNVDNSAFYHQFAIAQVGVVSGVWAGSVSGRKRMAVLGIGMRLDRTDSGSQGNRLRYGGAMQAIGAEKKS